MSTDQGHCLSGTVDEATALHRATLSQPLAQKHLEYEDSADRPPSDDSDKIAFQELIDSATRCAAVPLSLGTAIPVTTILLLPFYCYS